MDKCKQGQRIPNCTQAQCEAFAFIHNSTANVMQHLSANGRGVCFNATQANCPSRSCVISGVTDDGIDKLGERTICLCEVVPVSTYDRLLSQVVHDFCEHGMVHKARKVNGRHVQVLCTAQYFPWQSSRQPAHKSCWGTPPCSRQPEGQS